MSALPKADSLKPAQSASPPYRADHVGSLLRPAIIKAAHDLTGGGGNGEHDANAVMAGVF